MAGHAFRKLPVNPDSGLKHSKLGVACIFKLLGPWGLVKDESKVKSVHDQSCHFFLPGSVLGSSGKRNLLSSIFAKNYTLKTPSTDYKPCYLYPCFYFCSPCSHLDLHVTQIHLSANPLKAIPSSQASFWLDIVRVMACSAWLLFLSPRPSYRKTLWKPSDGFRLLLLYSRLDAYKVGMSKNECP